MASSPRTVERREEEDRRLNMRTLAIASAASASAAGVTSQLWIAGTWIAAALTPVLVALISEAMQRPTEKIARKWTTERPAQARATREAAMPVAAGAGRLPPDDAGELPPRAPEEPGAAGPIRVYRQPPRRTPRRRIAIGAVAATALIAFVVAIAAITAGDLISGGSIGKGASKTTFFRGGSGDSASERNEQSRPQDTGEQTQPQETPPTQSAPAAPAPAEPPAEEPPATPAPSEQPPGEPTAPLTEPPATP
jgi:hypothetical protein